MGYRSEVAYLITSAAPEKLKAFMLHVAVLEPTVPAALAECVLSTDGLGFHAEDVKWYEGYDDVDNHTLLWDAAEGLAETYELSGVFLRLGEDDADIEQRNFGEDPRDEKCTIHRSISYSFETDPKDDLRNQP